MKLLPRVVAAVLAAVLLLPAGADAKLVVRGTLVDFSAKTRTGTYSSAKGTFTAKWIRPRRYRLTGTIMGKPLRGAFRTRQAPSGEHYRVRGSGRLGDRRVEIRGGGPNSLRRATLILK